MKCWTRHKGGPIGFRPLTDRGALSRCRGSFAYARRFRPASLADMINAQTGAGFLLASAWNAGRMRCIMIYDARTSRFATKHGFLAVETPHFDTLARFGDYLALYIRKDPDERNVVRLRASRWGDSALLALGSLSVDFRKHLVMDYQQATYIVDALPLRTNSGNGSTYFHRVPQLALTYHTPHVLFRWESAATAVHQREDIMDDLSDKQLKAINEEQKNFTNEDRAALREPLREAVELALENGMSRDLFLFEAAGVWETLTSSEEEEFDEEDDTSDE